MPRKPEERILLLDRQPLHRLVAAGVDGADGDGTPLRPVEHLRVGAILRLLVGKRVAGEQELRAHQPDAVAGRTSTPSTSSGRATLIITSICPAVGSLGVGVEITGRLGSCFGLCRAPHLDIGELRMAGAEHDRAGVAVDHRVDMAVDLDRAEADHHRHAARAREHGDVAGGAAIAERDAAAGRPVGLEEAGRGHIVAGEDRARRSRCEIDAGEIAKHAVAKVDHVGGAGAEIFVVGGFVAGDLGVQRRDPGRLGAGSGLNPGSGRGDQLVVG